MCEFQEISPNISSVWLLFNVFLIMSFNDFQVFEETEDLKYCPYVPFSHLCYFFSWYMLFIFILHFTFLVCMTPSVPGGSVSCADTDSNGEQTPSPGDVCTATCTSGQTPTVAMATCQADMAFDATLECPAGKLLGHPSEGLWLNESNLNLYGPIEGKSNYETVSTSKHE